MQKKLNLKMEKNEEVYYCLHCDSKLDYYGAVCFVEGNQRHNVQRYYCSSCRTGRMVSTPAKNIERIIERGCDNNG